MRSSISVLVAAGLIVCIGGGAWGGTGGTRSRKEALQVRPRGARAVRAVDRLRLSPATTKATKAPKATNPTNTFDGRRAKRAKVNPRGSTAAGLAGLATRLSVVGQAVEKAVPSEEKATPGDGTCVSKELRTVFLWGPIDSECAFTVHSGLSLLAKLDRTTPILLDVKSPGGSVVDMKAIVDTMTTLGTPVYTICHWAMSAATAVVAAGTPGKRFVMPHAEFGIHSLSGGAVQLTDAIDTEAMRLGMNRERDIYCQLMSELSAGRRSPAFFKKHTADHNIKAFTAQEAQAMNLVDHVLGAGELGALQEEVAPAASRAGNASDQDREQLVLRVLQQAAKEQQPAQPQK